MTETWIPVPDAEGMAIGEGRPIRHDGRQIAVFRVGPGEWRAVDNACPHEGYPLVQGYVRDCVLTCAWHNYKFDLRDGACLQGDEDVATHPVRVAAGRVEVAPRAAGRAADPQKILASLAAGLLDRSMGRVARDVVRALRAGVDAAELVLRAALFDAERGEYGSTHALPVAADVLSILPTFTGMAAVLPVMQVMELAAEPNVRRPRRPQPEPTDPGADPAAFGRRLGELIEHEEGAAAEALLLGALRRGYGRAEIEPWLLAPCAEHFLELGHPLIYAIKAFDVADHVGWERARDLLPALCCAITTGTREDTLPPMAFLRELLAELEPRWPSWRAARRTLSAAERSRLVAALLDGDKHGAAAAVTAAFEAGGSEASIVDALTIAAARRLCRFDAAIDADDRVQDDWLTVTHTQTFTHAVRHALRRSAEPRLCRLVFFAAHFVQRTHPLDLPPERRREPDAGAMGATLPAVRAAIEARQPDAAVDAAAAWLSGGGDPPALRDACLDLAFGAHVTRPIVVAHAIKNTIAAFEESGQLGALADCTPLECALPVLAAVRFLASPVRERGIARLVHEAVRFVDGGKPPRRRSS